MMAALPEYEAPSTVLPGVRVCIGERGRDLFFVLEEDAYFIKFSKTVLASGSRDSSLNGSISGEAADDEYDGPVRQPRHISLNIEQCKSILEDVDVIREGCDALQRNEIVDFRGIYVGDVHVIIEQDSELVELRRCYEDKVESNTYTRTKNGVAMFPDEMRRALHLIELSVGKMKTQVRRVLVSNRKRKSGAAKCQFLDYEAKCSK